MNKKQTVKMIGIVLFWIVAWELADRLIDNRIVLSGPIHMIQALIELVKDPEFVTICMSSFLRIVAGFLISFLGGFLLALVSYRVKFLQDFLKPVMVVLKTVPMISFVIMLLIWVGNQALTIYLSFLIVLPLIYTNTLAGFEAVDKEMLEMAKVFHLPLWKRILYIYRPAFMPFLLSGCKISIGMSWKSGIMAEVIGTPEPSIGKKMFVAKQYLQTANLFAWTVVVIVLSIAFEKLFMLLMKQFDRPMGCFLGKKGGGQDAGKRTESM